MGTSRATLAYQVPHLPIQQLKKTVDDLQAKLALAKGEYKAALKSLERISDEIHERRRSNAMGPRGCGVGAEGSITSVENVPASKPEPDAISGESGQQRSVCVSCFQGRLVPQPLSFAHHRLFWWFLWDSAHQITTEF